MPDTHSKRPLAESTTSELLANARAGCKDAWFALDARIDRAVRRTLGPRVGGAEDLDDLTQEVKLRFFKRGIDAFEHRGSGSLTAFVRKDAHFHNVDQLRRRSRDRIEAGDGSNEADDAPPEPALEVTGHATRLAREDEFASIRAFVSSILSDEDKAAVRERFENNASWKTAVHAAGVSSSADALRKRLKRAFDETRQRFEGADSHPDRA